MTEKNLTWSQDTVSRFSFPYLGLTAVVQADEVHLQGTKPLPSGWSAETFFEYMAFMGAVTKQLEENIAALRNSPQPSQPASEEPTGTEIASGGEVA